MTRSHSRVDAARAAYDAALREVMERQARDALRDARRLQDLQAEIVEAQREAETR